MDRINLITYGMPIPNYINSIENTQACGVLISMDTGPFIRESLLLLQHQTQSPAEAVKLLGAIDRVILLGKPLDDLQQQHEEDPHLVNRAPPHVLTSDIAPPSGSWDRLGLYARIMLQPLSRSSSLLGHLHAAFYWGAFPALSDVLLPALDPAWLLDVESGPELKRLLHKLYMMAPAACTLSALVGHLATVTPRQPLSTPTTSSNRTRVTVAGSSMAVNLLAEWFSPLNHIKSPGLSSAGSPINGIEQLALHLAAAVSTNLWSHLSPAVCLPERSSGSCPVLLSDPDTLAGLLAGLPDRTSGSQGSSGDCFRDRIWFPSVIHCLLTMAESPASSAVHRVFDNLDEAAAPSDLNSAGGATGQSSRLLSVDRSKFLDEDDYACVGRSAEALLVSLINRLCARGHVSIVTTALIDHAQLIIAASAAGNGEYPQPTRRTLLPETMAGEQSDSVGESFDPLLQYSLEVIRLAGERASALRRVMLTLSSSGLRFEKLLDEVFLQLARHCSSFPPPLPAPREFYQQYSEQHKGQLDPLVSPSQPVGSIQGGPLAVLFVLLGGPALATSDIAYLLTRRMLLSKTLPMPVLLLLLDFLALISRGGITALGETEPEVDNLSGHPQPSPLPPTPTAATPWDLSKVAAAVSRTWGDPLTLSKLSLAHQGFLSHLLALLLCRLGPAAMQHHQPALLPPLLQGVSSRLGSNLVSQRRQAVRLGYLFSRLLDPTSDLFSDQESDWVDEEMWEGALSHPSQAHPAPLPLDAATHPQQDDPQSKALESPSSRVAALIAAESGGADSDDESAEEDGLPSFNVSEDPEGEAWAKADPKLLQLRPLAAALRKADDAQGVLSALSRLEVLVRACPDELSLAAPELVRSLMHCRVPEWAEAEAKSSETSPESQRLRCLAALCALCPVPSGDALVAELYSPHVDMYQRLLVLNALSVAAHELSHPELAPRLSLPDKKGTGAAQEGAPRVVCPDPNSGNGSVHNMQALSSSSEGIKGEVSAGLLALKEDQSARDGGAASRQRGKTRIWGPVALRKLTEAPPLTHRNAFGDVALQWASGLLRQADASKPCLDLLGRDSMVLGRLLATLASFSEYAVGSPAATPLACATLELLRSPQVHGHIDPYVRRAALLAVGQVVASLPAPRVASALLSSEHLAVGSHSSSLGGGDKALLERLEWVQGWVRGAAAGDSDETCRMMAEACVNIQAGAATAALQSLQLERQQQHLQQPLGGSRVSGGLLMPGEAGWTNARPIDMMGAGSPGLASVGRARTPLMVEIASLNTIH